MSWVYQQAKFYNENPPLIPWPNILAKKGLDILYKPREVFWKRELDKLNFKAGQKILEIGCGRGVMLARLAKHYRVKGIGVDISPKSIKFAKENFAGKSVSFLLADATKLPFKDKNFDLVVSFDVFEHIENQKKAIREAMRVLKPNGTLFVYALNKKYRFTLDWLWERLGFDILGRAAHKKELFIEASMFGKKANIKYFDALFTLLIDEIIMVKIFVLKKLGLMKFQGFGETFLFLANIFSRFVFWPATVLDLPWLSTGHSVGILIVVKKNG